MAESYSVKAILSATDKGFTSTLRNALSSVTGLAKSVGSGMLMGAGMAAFNALSNGARELVGSINDSNVAWKTFEGNMQIIEKSGGTLEMSIGEAKNALQDFAQKTVYSASDMASTYAQLAAVGTKNTAQLVKGFGGLAAAAENPQQAMKTLSQQATQMAAKTNVAWADFKLMLEQTPAGIAAVANQMGMSTAELVTAVQDGKVKTEDFFNAIAEVGGDANGEFYKMATTAKSVGQAMDGLKETIGNKLTPAFDLLSNIGIKAIEDVANKNLPYHIAHKKASYIDENGNLLSVADGSILSDACTRNNIKIKSKERFHESIKAINPKYKPKSELEQPSEDKHICNFKLFFILDSFS